MTPIGITLLVAGVLIFGISFIIPDKSDGKGGKFTEKDRDEIRKLMEKELDSMKLRVNEATNETVEFGMEKCERSLEKISNDKIAAVNEFATSVLSEIEKNHKEVMFLYDMLDSKQVDVKNTVRNAEATVREVNDVTNNAIQQKEAVEVQLSESQKREEALNRQLAEVTNMQPRIINREPELVSPESVIKKSEPVEIPVQPVKKPEPVFFSGKIDQSIFEKMERPPINQNKEAVSGEPKTLEEAATNNAKILTLSKQGKDVVEIARELNLGVGEVKLVLDLYR